MSPSEAAAFAFYLKVSAFIKSVEKVAKLRVTETGKSILRGFYEENKTPEETAAYCLRGAYLSNMVFYHNR